MEEAQAKIAINAGLDTEVKKLIEETLVVGREDRIQELVVECRGLLRIVKETGEIVVHTGKLSDGERIGLYGLGKHLLSQYDSRYKEEVTTSEISKSLGIDSKIVSARLSDLAKLGMADSPKKGVWKVVPATLLDLVKKAKSKVG